MSSGSLRAPRRGLSPLTRGNRLGWSRSCHSVGPIPAHAGQPCCRCGRPRRARAYPRSRGATVVGAAEVFQQQGLSPLTRGNLLWMWSCVPCFGPIPAHAGQPRPPSPAMMASRAYPRSRGATRIDGERVFLDEGLSPLTRGNLGQLAFAQHGRGPIPAHAGQPAWVRADSAACWAYPRSRGATASSRLARALL